MILTGHKKLIIYHNLRNFGSDFPIEKLRDRLDHFRIIVIFPVKKSDFRLLKIFFTHFLCVRDTAELGSLV